MSDNAKTKICSYCNAPNSKDATECERCRHPLLPQTVTEEKDKQKFKYICPFKFHDMNKKMKLDKSDSEPDLKDLLVYEVFEMGDMTLADFLDEMDLSDIGFMPVSDEVYERTWHGIEGSTADRFLLYPAGDKCNRLYVPDTGTADGTSKYALKGLKNLDRSKCGEISLIFECIDKSDDYEYEEICVKGFDGSRTYSYNIISTMNYEVIFSIRPCCPICRTLLPDNWFSSAVYAYIPIALIGSTSAGKTTYMTSLLDPVFKELVDGLGGISKWSVVSSIEEEKSRFKIQETRYKNYKRLRQEGTYPKPTESVMPPVLITLLKHEGFKVTNQIVVGIFDCKGEPFNPDADMTEEAVPKKSLLKFLNSMQSFIYLVEPKQMAGIRYRFEPDKKFEPSLIKSFDEQGKFQQEHRGEIIKADAVIKNDEEKNRKIVDIHRMLIGICNNIAPGNDSLQHIAYTIVKSDELDSYRDDWSEVKEMDELLKPGVKSSVLYTNGWKLVDAVVSEFFEKVVFSSADAHMRDFRNIGGENVSKSWHCVSVARKLPPNERTDGRECEFAPVRITEPFVRCLIKELKNLGLLNEQE